MKLDFILLVLKRREDSYPFSKCDTRDYEGADWRTLKDARGYGVPRKLFYDTKDKLVLTPLELTCHEEDIFFYDPWFTSSGFDEIIQGTPRQKEYVETLVQVGRIFDQFGICVKMVHVNGEERGYISVYEKDVKEYDFEQDQEYMGDPVLWIYTRYTLTYELFKGLQSWIYEFIPVQLLCKMILLFLCGEESKFNTNPRSTFCQSESESESEDAGDESGTLEQKED